MQKGWKARRAGGLLLWAALGAHATQVAPTHWAVGEAHPYGLALDGRGQVYVTRHGSDSVVRISAAGEVQVLGTTGMEPMGIALDGAGHVYTTNFGSDTVTRITPEGAASTLARTGRNPMGIVWDAVRGVLYVADTRSDTVTRITPEGESSVLGGTGKRPMGIALDAQGNVYTADHLSNTVTRITPEGQSRVLGHTGLRPFGIAVDVQGNIYTANHGSNTVTKITPAGVSSTLGRTGLHPFGIAVDAQGHVYTSNYDSGTVSHIAPDGTSTLWGGTGAQPMGLAVDGAGRIYTANYGGHSVTRLEVVNPPGPPLALRAEAVDGGVRLRWQPPAQDGSGPVQDYVVEYRRGRQDAWRVVEEGVSTATEAVLDGLSAGQPYEWRVSAVNWVGAGAPHAPVAVGLPAPASAAAPVPVAAPGPASTSVAAPAVATAIRPPAPLPPGCAPLLTRLIRAGADNDPTEVNRLIAFLDASEGEALPMDGSYDEDDVEAVKRFQLRHAQDILAPFGIGRPTGLVSTMTREKINALHCRRRPG